MNDLGPFLAAFDRLPTGHSEGVFENRRWRAAVKRSDDGRRASLLAEPLGEPGLVSFNLYRPRRGDVLLKPCEMPQEKVVAFVLGYRPEQSHGPAEPITRGK